MIFYCQFKKLDYNEELVKYVHERLEKLDKWQRKKVRAQAIVSKQGFQICAQMTITTPQQVFRSEASSEDFYVAIDSAVDKLATQLKKRRQKLRNHRNYAISTDNDDRQSA